MATVDLHLHDIHKGFGTFKALDGVSLDVAAGELVCLLGHPAVGRPHCFAVSPALNVRIEVAFFSPGATSPPWHPRREVTASCFSRMRCSRI